MTKTLFLALVAAAALAGCDQSDHTINGNAPYDPQANATAAAPIELPPAIVASHAYRCKDNSLVYIDWLSDGSARVKTEKTGRATTVKVGESGSPLQEGEAQAESVTFNGSLCNR